MTQIAIPARVVNGHLQHEQNLTELEGQHVIATLTVAPQRQGANAGVDPEPPLWLEVEHDIYFPITVPEVSLGKVNLRVEDGKPSIILPEDLPDE